MDYSMNNNTLDPNVGMTENIIHEYQLPKLIGPEKWRDLARMLDFSQNDIDAIQAEKINCPKECCIAVLVKWIHRKGLEATIGKLADALVKIELKSVADKLKAPVNNRRTLTFEVGGTIKVDDENQIILGYDRTGTSTFFVWETTRKEFNTSLKEIKDYINAIGQITGNTPKETETNSRVEFSDLTFKVNQISDKLEILQMILSNITSSLEMHELKEETFTVQKRLDIIGTQGRNLVELYSKVTGMTKQACRCDEIERKQFYDFTFHSLKAVHNDLNARVADLQSGVANMTKEDNEKLQTLLADQREREKQVERLEEVRALLHSPTEEELRISRSATLERRNTEPSLPVQTEEELRISQYATPERRNMEPSHPAQTEEELRISQYATPEKRNTEPSIPVQMQGAHSDATSPRKTIELKRTNTWSSFRSKGKSNENVYSLVFFSKKALEDS